MAALEIAVVVLLVLLNGFLAMSELAVVSSRRTRLERLAASGLAGARAALSLANDPGRFLATLQVGLTSIAILAGIFSGATLAQRVDDWLDLFPAIAPYSKPAAFAFVLLGSHLLVARGRRTCSEANRAQGPRSDRILAPTYHRHRVVCCARVFASIR